MQLYFAYCLKVLYTHKVMRGHFNDVAYTIATGSILQLL